MIHVLSKSKKKHIGSLYSKKYRLRHKETIVEGLRSVEAALTGGAEILDLLTTSDHSRTDWIKTISKALGDRHVELGAKDLESISGVESSPGIIAIVGIPEEKPLDTVSSNRVLVLDEIQDPGNLGTIMRSAAWFNFSHLILSKGCVDPYAPKVIRSSMGGLWNLELSYGVDLKDVYTRLKDATYHLVAADMAGERASDFTAGKIALILGNEAKGLSSLSKEWCDSLMAIAKISDGNNPESLNVSSAAAILMDRLSAPTLKV